MAYRPLLRCQPLPRWLDRPGGQSFVQWRRFRIAPLAFCHCNSACRHQGSPIDFQRRHLDLCHERCKLLYFRLDSNDPGSRCKWYVRESRILYDANLDYRHGSQVPGLHRPTRPSRDRGHSPASLRLPGIHQPVRKRRNDLHLAPFTLGPFHSLHLWWHRPGSYPLPQCLVSNRLSFSSISR